mgnify:CR=1 FL=1
MAVPALVGQVVNLLYNIVDRIYIGHIPEIGDLALTGVGVCMPVIMIVSAFAALVSSGGAPKASICMGRGDKEEAEKIIDAGIKTTQRDTDAIKSARTVIWNGTVGMAEWMPTWSYGSFALAKTIAQQTRDGKLESIVGGGDTVAALEACGVKDDITYVSTGGGAFLEFVEGRVLPGIAILESK